MLSWVRPCGELYVSVWCQADQTGWDTYAGPKFVVEFQLGCEPVIGKSEIRRARIGKMLSAAELRRHSNDSEQSDYLVTRPPKSHALLNAGEELSAWYLKQFKSSDQPYSERDDIWFRYGSKEDVDTWARFLITKLPDCFRQVETWDDPMYTL